MTFGISHTGLVRTTFRVVVSLDGRSYFERQNNGSYINLYIALDGSLACVTYLWAKPFVYYKQVKHSNF